MHYHKQPMSVCAYYHIQNDLLEGGDRAECCAHACVLSLTLIAMYECTWIHVFPMESFRMKTMHVYGHEAPGP